MSAPVQVRRAVLRESRLVCSPQAIQGPHLWGQTHQEALHQRPGIDTEHQAEDQHTCEAETLKGLGVGALALS